MNPYPHHASLAGSPHHPPGGGGESHHSYGSTPGTASTPDPSPHSPAYGAGPQDSGPQVPYAPSHQQQPQSSMASNGHHHAQMMQQAQEQSQHHRPYQHPHIPTHLPYPPVNHNNNLPLKFYGLSLSFVMIIGSFGNEPCPNLKHPEVVPQIFLNKKDLSSGWKKPE
ncbi:hypothetical protein QAD02_001570 [Eretmocerus hayati]|uniref:Uncharacterized protein n=1 Tax=Eretmocerus hayati TaxID=131215 RepID=A0ACC2NGW2_9HYME|nr:hypothetical protein QAD02_001570 [Eretmocerus hayati]